MLSRVSGGGLIRRFEELGVNGRTLGNEGRFGGSGVEVRGGGS